MIDYRISYVNGYGEERISPFILDNIEEARQYRKMYQERGYHSIRILAYRHQDNNPLNDK